MHSKIVYRDLLYIESNLVMNWYRSLCICTDHYEYVQTRLADTKLLEYLCS